jgi:predicted DNA-binding transcriptional regulator YafY
MSDDARSCATASPPDAAGWTTATVPIESLTHATTELLKLGADLEVVEPRELRARLITEIRRLAALYVEEPSWPATV